MCCLWIQWTVITVWKSTVLLKNWSSSHDSSWGFFLLLFDMNGTGMQDPVCGSKAELSNKHFFSISQKTRELTICSSKQHWKNILIFGDVLCLKINKITTLLPQTLLQQVFHLTWFMTTANLTTAPVKSHTMTSVFLNRLNCSSNRV